MPSIRLSGVSFGYGANLILDDLSAHLQGGWYGLVGANGSGKTTLARLLAGELQPSTGTVALEPSSSLVAVCEQSVEFPSDDTLALAESYDRASLRLQARLELNPAQLERCSRLSPGERKRWQLAGALAKRPDVLLLDEPSNHMDGHCRHIMLAALQRFRGLGLVVSHDRALLDALTMQTLRLIDGDLEVFPGSYSAARAAWIDERRQRVDEHERLRSQERAVVRKLADARRKRSAAASKLSARARMKGPKDADGRSVNAKGRVARAEAGLSRQVAVRRRELARATSARNESRIERQRGGSLFLDYEPPRKGRLLDLQLPSLKAGDRLLAKNVSLTIERHSRLCITGRNGAGKSTLVRAIMAALPLPAQRVLYLPQELDDDDEDRLATTLVTMRPRAKTRILQIADALGLSPERALAGGRLSPGELRKLAIAIGLGQHVWVAILDEPSNHLDLPSIERLQSALADYPGALVLVSHDPGLVRALTGEHGEEVALGVGSRLGTAPND